MANLVKVRVISDGGYNGMDGVELGFEVMGRYRDDNPDLVVILGGDLNLHGASFKYPNYPYAFWVGCEVRIIEEIAE